MRLPVTALSAVLAVVLAVLSGVSPAVAGVDDFRFSSMDADYTLDRDPQGHSTLRTVERLTAVFPETDQNHGIRRAIPLRYQDVPTDVRIVSVTDGNGKPLSFETDEEDDFLLVTIAAEGFVHGSRTYVLTYDQRNVTRLFPGSGSGGADVDEFYWDVNGTGWAQPFDRVTARLHLGAALAGALTGDATCYSGREGSTDRCAIDSADEGTGRVLTASAEELGPYENLTIAVGFVPGTFTARDDSLFASPLGAVLIVGLVVLLAAVAAAVWYRATRLRDAPGRPTIVPEYLPLAEPDLLVSAVLVRRTRRAVAATLVSLAVRGVLRIVEVGSGFRRERYAVELASLTGTPRLGSGPTAPAGLEPALLGALFPTLGIGQRTVLDPKDTSLSRAVYRVARTARAEAVVQQLQRKPPAGPRILLAVGAFAGILLTGIAAIGLLDAALGGVVPGFALFAIPLGILAFVLPARRPLTARGAEVRDHLLGIRDYLKLAETDRLRVLPSPSGAERTVTDRGEVVRLYERLLPHAVLFSVEKEWARELGTWYEQDSSRPDWYVGSSTFNAVAFSSGISHLAGTAASAYSGSSSSSSSGGSGGGGFSGGGGGGGGGGGV